ncbi:MAG: hypothetical protein HC875_35925 [Anaerolineales bacterium]|nr:hypothetical protein [Anaerolineales bacterium]
MPSLQKSRWFNLLGVAIIFPPFLFLIVLSFWAGSWGAGIIFTGILIAVILFAISDLFKALVAFLGAIYVFSQGHWLIGLVLLALTGYLIFAATLTDKDMAQTFTQLNSISPPSYNLLKGYLSVFNKYSKELFVIILGVILAMYICVGLIAVGSLLH